MRLKNIPVGVYFMPVSLPLVLVGFLAFCIWYCLWRGWRWGKEYAEGLDGPMDEQ